jgi:hypothetical protein
LFYVKLSCIIGHDAAAIHGYARVATAAVIHIYTRATAAEAIHVYPRAAAAIYVYHRAAASDKMECTMGNSQMFPSRPRGVSEEKTQEKPSEKKDAGNYLPYTSRYVTFYKVTAAMNICTNAHII